VLAYLRREAIRSRGGPFLSAKQLAALGPRLRGETSEERLHLIQRLMRRARLVVDERGLVRPGPDARDWLRASPSERSRTLLQAWRADKGGHELQFVEGLRWESSDRPYDASLPREAILSHLATCPSGTWISLPSFVDAMRATDPDFLRPDGDYDSWYIRDTKAERFLTGFESWDRVEGRLIAHIITHQLRWLGLLAVGQAKEGAAQTVFRLTPVGLTLLGLPSPESRDDESRTISVSAELLIRAPQNLHLYDRYQLERFAEWEAEEDGSLRYRLSRASVWRGQAQGIEINQMIAFLRRATGGDLPDEVPRRLMEWGSRYGKVALQRAILLRTRDEATMRDLREHSALATLLGEQLSPRIALVNERDFDLVVRALKQMGYWPLVERRKGRREGKE